MKTGRLVTVLSFAVSACVFADTPVITAKINTVPGAMGGMLLTDYGHMFYAMQDPVSNTQDCYYNSTNLSAALLGNDRYALSTGLSGGSYAWFGSGSATGGTGKTRAFINSTDMSAQYWGTTNYSWAKTAGISPAGLLWYGKKTNGTNLTDVYRDGTLISGGLGTVRRMATGVGIDNAGNALWHGYGSNDLADQDVYLNSTNISKNLLGSSRVAQAAMISPNGTYVWYGWGTATGGTDHGRAYKGTTDISTPVIGPTGDGRAVLVNDAGQVAWVAYLHQNNGLSDVYLDSVNLSGTILGNNREAWPLGLGKDGSVMWYGSGDNLDAVQDIFINNINISKAALGSGRPGSIGIGINNQGWAVWQTPTVSATFDVRVTMLCNKTLAGNLGLSMYTGNPSSVPVTVNIREVNQGWNMGDVPVTLDAYGNFSVALPTGVFDLTFKSSKFLNKKITNVDTRLGGEPLTLTLAAGDADGNNVVDLNDMNSVVVNFGTTALDLNGDGIDDMYDLNVVFTNFGLQGD